MRARKKNWAENELETNPIIINEPFANKGKWREIFGNNNPIYVEIGCGMGNFITETARLNKNINFIAIEREKMVIVSGARKMRELKESGENCENILFTCADASNLEEIFESGEINRIYLNFSDPWSRRRKWAKRRLTHRNFLNKYKILLGEKCEIHMKTDNRILFEFSLSEFSAMGWGMKNISLDLHNSDFADENIQTEYEKKFSAKGMPIYRLEAFFPNEPASDAIKNNQGCD